MAAKRVFISFLFICCYCFIFGQETIVGVVKDALTKTPLPFAAVQYSDGRGVITNEEGRFYIPKNEGVTTIKISYVGYELLTMPVTESDESLEVLLTQTALLIDEIIVLANDNYASSLLYKSIGKSRKKIRGRLESKAFRRTYSYRDNQPSEHMEAFYTAKTRDGGVDYFYLKNGKYGVPSDTSFINMHMTNLLENYQLFSSEFSKLPSSPLEYTSLKKLRKDFDVRLLNKYVVEQDTIIELSFEPLRKKDLLFEGKVWVRHSNLIIEKVELAIQNTSRNPFLIVPDSESNKVKALDLNFTIGFKYHDDKSVFDYIHSSYKMSVTTPVEDFEVSSNTNFYFYDYGKAFFLPLFPEFIDRFHDYEKILCFPHDEVFWNKNYLIAETEAELQFRKELESKNLFKNQNGEQAALIQRRFEPWSKDWNIESQLIADRELWAKGEVDEILYINRIGVPEEYTLFAKTFIFLDYACYGDTVVFNTEAILDYRFSFSIDQTFQDFRYLEDFLRITKIHANNLEMKLIEKYAGLNTCPDRSELADLLAEANKSLDQSIEFFNDQLHMETMKQRKKIVKEIHSNLKKSFETLKTMNLGVEVK